jgi:hypothetical protein
MFAQPKLLLSAAIVLGSVAGAAPLAQAGMGGGGYDYETYGGPHQTWCDVDPNCNGWNRTHASPYAGSARAFAVAPVQKHHSVHKRGHDANTR